MLQSGGGLGPWDTPPTRWCWVSSKRSEAPAAHSWPRVGAGNLRRLCPPQLLQRGHCAHQSLGLGWQGAPLILRPPAAIWPCPSSEKEEGQPTFLCMQPLPTAAFPTLLLPGGPGAPHPVPACGSGSRGQQPHSGSVWGPWIKEGAERQHPLPHPGSLCGCVNVPGSRTPRVGSGTRGNGEESQAGAEEGSPAGQWGLGVRDEGLGAHPVPILHPGWQAAFHKEAGCIFSCESQV